MCFPSKMSWTTKIDLIMRRFVRTDLHPATALHCPWQRYCASFHFHGSIPSTGRCPVLYYKWGFHLKAYTQGTPSGCHWGICSWFRWNKEERTMKNWQGAKDTAGLEMQNKRFVQKAKKLRIEKNNQVRTKTIQDWWETSRAEVHKVLQ